MYTCPNCKYTSETMTTNCSICGAPMMDQNSIVMQDIQPTYKKSSAPSLAKQIVGMVLSIEGIITSAIGLLYTLMFMGLDGTLATIYAVVFLIFSLPGSLLGLIFSKKCIRAGSTSTMCSVGKNLGIAGIVLSGVLFFLVFVAAAM